MTTKIQKCGNSLGMRISKDLADSLDFRSGTEVKLVRERRGLLVKPVRRQRQTLDELLAQIKPETLHDELDWGKPVGKEVW